MRTDETAPEIAVGVGSKRGAMIFPGQWHPRTGPMPHDNGSPANTEASSVIYGEGWLGIAWSPQYSECITTREAIAKYGSAEGWIAVKLLTRAGECGAVEVPEPEYLRKDLPR